MTNDKKYFMTATEVADLMRVSPAQIRLLARTQKLPFEAVRFGGIWRFRRSDVLKYFGIDEPEATEITTATESEPAEQQ